MDYSMDRAYNRRYFSQGSSWLIWAGFALAAAGALIWWYAFEIWFIGTPIALIGLGIGIFAMVRRIKDSDIDTQIERFTRDIEAEAVRKTGLDEKKLTTFPPHTINVFEFGRTPESMLKKGSDGKIRTSDFAACVFLFGAQRMFVYRRAVSLIEDRLEETMDAFPYTDIDKVVQSQETFTCDKPAVNCKYGVLSLRVIRDGTSVEAFRTQTPLDADIDKMADDINRFSERARAKKEDTSA